MQSKQLLFIGIFLLIIGIVLKKTTQLSLSPILFMVVGVLLKTIYIVNKARSGAYKPGKELIFLLVGLTLFLSGIYYKSQILTIYASVLIYVGLSLKVLFIILFIKKVKSAKIE